MKSPSILYPWERLFSLMDLDPLESGLQILGAGTTSLDPTRPTLLCKREGEVITPLISLSYPEDHRAKLVLGTGPDTVIEAPLSELREHLEGSQPWFLYLPPLAPVDGMVSFEGLRSIVARLRSPDGCPWDREQTHESLKGTLLEEAYEVLEALDCRDREKLREELGDLLMQVMIHAQIAEEAREFTISQVIGGISQKLIRRHPHVFGDITADTAQEVMVNWESIKRKERPHGSSSLANLPKQMPALAYAQAVQQRVARQGFDWQNVEGVIDKLLEEAREVVEAGSKEEKLHEMGDLFFALVNLARWLGLDAEESLRLADDRFIRRFS
ncbi:MAG: nucleoside triphosphate pyrophosphohydrolase, partial [Dehalococcoidia bacterium]|nr:nucleoside triphosphate pyrophosphohydrolase [Dehalococcoidia bacterium]